MIHSPIGQTNLMFGVSLHSLLVHFPIALTFVACGYDGWAVYARRSRLHRVGSSLIKLAAGTAVAATATGLDLAGISGLGSASSVTGHAGMALISTLVLSVTAIVRYSAEMRTDTPDAPFSVWMFSAEVVAVVLVFATAVLGHRI